MMRGLALAAVAAMLAMGGATAPMAQQVDGCSGAWKKNLPNCSEHSGPEDKDGQGSAAQSPKGKSGGSGNNHDRD